MDKKKLGLWAPILVLAAALVMLAVSTDSVDAARGKGGGKPSRDSVCTTCLTVNPNPVPVNTQSIVITGNGLAANQQLAVQLFSVCCFVPVNTDSTGHFSLTYNRNFNWPSTYRVEVYGPSGTIVATTTFAVQ